MEPRIQYAKTSDGVSIAYAVMGAGTPLVQMPMPPLCHLQFERQIPEIREWYDRIAEKRMLVRYDSRGTGLSERGVSDLSVQARMLDVDAVVERLGLEKFVLLAYIHNGPLGIAYAAQHPERLSHLVLCSAYSRGTDFVRSPEVQGARAVLDKDWHTFSETAARANAAGWEARELPTRLAALIRESTTQEVWQVFAPALAELDVTDLLPQLRTPTLVLHSRQGRILPVDVAMGIAGRIPDARLALLEGDILMPYIGDSAAVAEAIDEFLGEGETPGPSAQAPSASGLVTILFTDIVGHTEMMSRLGDARGREVLREHERITREVPRAHGGTEVKTMGDGFMASFGSVTRAVECAIALQREMGNEKWEMGERIQVRCGLNAGEPIEEEGPDGRSDLFGATVILASRIAGRAEGGEILVADTVRGLCSGKGFAFADRGEFTAKGFEEPVRVCEVRW